MLSDSDIGESSSGKSKGGGRRRSRTTGTRSTGRASPLGAEREREFPTTKVGSLVQGGVGEGKGCGGGGNSSASAMGGGDQERQYASYHAHALHSGRCAGSHSLVASPAPSLTRPIIQGDLVQSRDFHYNVEPVYRRPREVLTYHRNEALPDYAYMDHHKSSPYHSGTLRTSLRGLPEDMAGVRGLRNMAAEEASGRASRALLDSSRGIMDSSRGVMDSARGGNGGGGVMDPRSVAETVGRLDQNYMMVRAQSRLQDGYDRLSHRSESRNDILDSDNSLYDHNASIYYQPGQYNGFVRTCDGKFIRTSLPQHEFDSLEENPYRNSSAMHTLRRTSKGRHQNPPAEYCCPSRDDLSGGLRPSDQLQQSYATLRGRKWTEKNCGRGVGDNYGRHNLDIYTEDARSVHSLADDFLLPVSRSHAHHTKSISRSTDKSLDSLGLEEEDDEGRLLPAFPNINTMLKREPPDGKEKPEPPKQQQQQQQQQLQQLAQQLPPLEGLSRKNSKCDLVERVANDNLSDPLTRAGHHLLKDPGHHLLKADATSHHLLKEPGHHLLKDPGHHLLKAEAGHHLLKEPGHHMLKADPGHLLKGEAGHHMVAAKRESLAASGKEPAGSGTGGFLDPSGMSGSAEEEQPAAERLKDWKVPSSPRCQSMNNVSLVPVPHPQLPANPGLGGCISSPKSLGTPALPRGRQPSLTSQMAARALNTSQYSEPCTSLSPLCQDQPSMPIQVKTYFTRKILRFFGVDSSFEDQAKVIWGERRKRLAIKKLGGIKEEEFLSGFGVENSAYSGYSDAYGHPHPASLTSELEGDKMVLKIAKPPRDKDSIMSLSWQCCSWMVSSMKKAMSQSHPLQEEHLLSRSYLPSAAGQAAFYQAETCGGLAVCQPLTRISNHHHYQGESPAEEVFFSRPTSQPDPPPHHHQKAYSHDPYRYFGCQPVDYFHSNPYYYCNCRSCSWQLPKVESEVPRMSSDVGVSRIWNRMLDAAFDNSNRRKHGMGLLGKVLRKRRPARHVPEPSRKRKLGGNARDHRPYFTYWVSFVQVAILFISLLLYGFGPIGVDLYKKSGMVLVTSLSLETVGYLEPANFWIGPSALDLIHLGAKYGPCMRWDENIDRQIGKERIKERDTACCLREDQAGCVQTQKSECKSAAHNGVNAIPAIAKHKWRLAVGVRNPWDYKTWDDHGTHHDKWSQYPDHHRSSGPVCGLDPAFCEAPASIAPYIWPDDITKWPICRKRKEHTDAPPSEAEHMVCEVIGHPCCIGIRGQCQITTLEFCDFVKGKFHEEAALCSQVSCMDDVCGLIPFRQRDTPDQFYRIWTSLFLHAGIFHLAITLLFQYWLMRDLEKLAGAKRTGLIYLASGMVGNLASAIFVPNRAEVGPAGAHFGLLAAAIVEVIHQWPSLKYPEMAILKLVGVTAVLFLAGLLPWIDNYAHLFGFVYGFLLAYAMLPFVTFGVYGRRRKVAVVWICTVLALLLFTGLILLFYVSPVIQDCEICKYFNCIPITKDFCSEQNIDLGTEV